LAYSVSKKQIRKVIFRMIIIPIGDKKNLVSRQGQDKVKVAQDRRKKGLGPDRERQSQR
jgi:hypothetical protein